MYIYIYIYYILDTSQAFLKSNYETSTRRNISITVNHHLHLCYANAYYL